MTLYGEPRVWLEQFPVGEPQPITHDYHGVRYLGEVIRADSWSPECGEFLRGETFFRIVLLRQRRSGLRPAIGDPRTVICLPASGLTRQRNRLTGDLVPLLLWDQHILDWAGPIGSAAPPDWNGALPWLAVLSRGLTAVDQEEDFRPQEQALLESTAALESEVAQVQGFLRLLAGPTGDAETPDLADSLERLSGIGGDDFQSVFRAVRNAYTDYRHREEDLAVLRRLSQVSGSAGEMLAAREYVDWAVVPSQRAELSVERQALLAALAPESLVQASRSWCALALQISGFRSRYAAAYRVHHQDFHQSLPTYQYDVDAARLKLRALEFLNTVSELGEPVRAGLAQALDRLGEVPPPCLAPTADLDIEASPLCPACGLTLEQGLPIEEMARLASRIDAALGEKNRRLSNLLVERIIRGQMDQQLEDFLKVVQASDLSALSNTLNEELLAFIWQLLA